MDFQIDKHNRITKKLEHRIKSNFAIMGNNVEYFEDGQPIGEVDLVGYRAENNAIYLFQIKTSNIQKTKDKAIKQLIRDEEKYVPIFKDETGFPVTKIFKYYVSEKNGKLHVEYINRKLEKI